MTPLYTLTSPTLHDKSCSIADAEAIGDIDEDEDDDHDHDEAPAAVAPVRERHHAVLRQLVIDHRHRLQRLVVRHIGNSDEADDIAQQAFYEAARNIDRFRGESELSTWLYGIAMNLVRNHLNRAPHRVHRFESSDALHSVHCADGDPSDIVGGMQIMRKIDDSMEMLSPDMREVLRLVGVEQISYEKAASILCVPVGTVRSRLSRARAALRSRMSSVGLDMATVFAERQEQ